VPPVLIPKPEMCCPIWTSLWFNRRAHRPFECFEAVVLKDNRSGWRLGMFAGIWRRQDPAGRTLPLRLRLRFLHT